MAVLQNWFILNLVMQTTNLAAIFTPAYYNTRPLDTIYRNFIATNFMQTTNCFVSCNYVEVDGCIDVHFDLDF